MSAAACLPGCRVAVSSAHGHPRPPRPAKLCTSFSLSTSRAHVGQPISSWRGNLTRRREGQWIAAAASGGGGGSSGGSGSGGGGGGDDDEQPGGGNKPSKPVFGWKGWHDRVAADPQFVYKVLVEQIIGVSANVAGDMATRPNWGLNELDFVFATLVVGSIINFAAVYLLAPVASTAGASTAQLPLMQKLFGDHFLTSWHAPAGHMFQPGFALGKRVVNFGYKGAVFALIGMCAGLVGTATSNGLLQLRKRMDPSYTSPNEAPGILANASCWALHMGLSANLRYQIINGLDMVLQPLMPSGLFRLYTSVIRGTNNLAGGATFVMAAKALGVQKAADSPAHDVSSDESSHVYSPAHPQFDRQFASVGSRR